MASGRPLHFPLEIQVQKSRKPLRCQDTTVSGLTMIKARRQCFQVLERHSQNNRSAFRSRGLARAAPLEHCELLAEGQVLQSNLLNSAGQNEKANQRTKQRNHEIQREGQRVGKSTISRRTEFWRGTPSVERAAERLGVTCAKELMLGDSSGIWDEMSSVENIQA